MRTNFYSYKAQKVYRRVLEGDGGTSNNDGGTSTNDGGGTSGEQITILKMTDPRTGRQVFKTQDGTPLFTQEHMNKEIGEARKKANEKQADLIKQLETIRDQSSTSDSLRAELQSQIDDLKAANLTVQQQHELEMKRWQKKYDSDIKAFQDQANLWQTQYAQSRIAQEIREAATKYKALPLALEQLDALIGSQAVIRPIKVDGKEVPGQFEAVCNFRDTDDNGAPVMTVLPIEKAVARMRELPQRFGNLFESDQKNGIGGGTLMGQNPLAGAAPNLSKMTMADYIKWREANPDKVGEQS